MFIQDVFHKCFNELFHALNFQFEALCIAEGIYDREVIVDTPMFDLASDLFMSYDVCLHRGYNDAIAQR